MARTAAPALLNVRQVAAQLGVSEATVYALVAEGALAHSRVRNSIRIPAQAVLDFLAAPAR